MTAALGFGILGPLEVRRGGETLALAPKQRAILAYLLLHANEVVSSERLRDELWGAERASANAVQVHVSKLRKALGGGALETRGRGYVLTVDSAQLDLARFEELARAGREALAAGRPADAARLLGEAEALWRGAPLADLVDEPFVAEAAAPLEELRLAAIEDRLEAELALGHHASCVAELEVLTRSEPLRERLCGQLMLALYRSGRQADALAAYRRTRAFLADELGLEPGRELRELEAAMLRQEPALAAPTPRTESHLPAPVTALVGRERELEHVVELVLRGDVRALTITGPGGIGKTRVAIEAARRLEPEIDVVFVAFAEVEDDRRVQAALAAGLGLTEGGVDPAERVERHLARRELLLVADNLEHLPGAAPSFSRLLAAAPGVTLLVTSRAPLRIAGEHELPLGSLDPEPAAELFVDRAAAVDPEFDSDSDREAVADLCARLDGLPLAIELAAARTRILRPRALLDRLGRRLDLLAGGPRDAPERQQTLRATIDWSYRLLDPGARRLFARLSVFAGGASLEAIEVVADGDAIGPLEALVAGSLVRRRDGRFGMLETVREYAADRLAESSEQDEVRRLHAAYLLELLRAAQGDFNSAAQADWLTLLEREHANLRAAVAYGLEHDPELALELVGFLLWLWLLHGHLALGRETVEAALAAAPSGPPQLLADAHKAGGILAAEQGDVDSAARHIEAALELVRDLGEPVRIATMLSNLGNVKVMQEDRRRARELYEESRALCSAVGNRDGVANACVNLGGLLLEEGEVAAAVECLEECVEAAAASGRMDTRAQGFRGLARALVEAGELERAERTLAEALELVSRMNDVNGFADCLDVSAALAGARGEPDLAVTLFAAAAARRSEIGARPSWFDAQMETRWLGRLRADLDEDAYDDALARGRSLTLDESLALVSAARR